MNSHIFTTSIFYDITFADEILDFNKMKIIGTGRSHPSLVVTNEMLSQILDTSDEWITTRTGIKERRVISSENLEDLAIDAAKKALADANIDAKDLDYIIPPAPEPSAKRPGS